MFVSVNDYMIDWHFASKIIQSLIATDHMKTDSEFLSNHSDPVKDTALPPFLLENLFMW